MDPRLWKKELEFRDNAKSMQRINLMMFLIIFVTMFKKEKIHVRIAPVIIYSEKDNLNHSEKNRLRLNQSCTGECKKTIKRKSGGYKGRNKAQRPTSGALPMT